jgi:hypothetical protein
VGPHLICHGLTIFCNYSLKQWNDLFILDLTMIFIFII